MNEAIVTHEKLDIQALQTLRAKLFDDLRALEALPQHELKRRYYQIQPQLRDVCRELATMNGKGKRAARRRQAKRKSKLASCKLAF